ncbi:hypothetical protein EDM57_11195 [Brevibacillus gelatini]|uniref:Uncharacterized protein n=2 Tax=Brevibacillus gelatini TaxID=1655277 RepID=A0A3M8B0N2_9BACL|nr:hypothetical protein [Brevibacillus gelatini]RNB56882.1 hypothetical protein EDM57_11195 [Brevibacillus gelatini]
MYTSLTVKYLKISSYIKLCVGAGFSLGLLIGLFQLVVLLLMRAVDHTGTAEATSILGSLLRLVGTVSAYTLGALFFSLISYFPFMFLLKRKNGIAIEGIFDSGTE